MSSVEESDHGEDSLSEELLEVFNMKRVHRQKNQHRGSGGHKKENELHQEAFRQFMFGNFQQASEKCKKLITMNPQNPEPYFTMATMYEEAAQTNENYSEMLKAAEYFFFNAYYSPPDLDKWLKVAELSAQLRKFPEAAYAYGRAIKINGSNLETNLKRCSCLEKCHEYKKAINIYKRILQKISTSAEVYKRYARLQFTRGQYSKSREVLLSYEKYDEDINFQFMICETYLKERKYSQLFSFIEDHILKGENLDINDLQIEIVQMLYICSICSRTPLDSQSLKSCLFDEYNEAENSNLYEEIIEHIQDHNIDEMYAFQKFLLGFKSHQKVKYFLEVSEYLRKKDKIAEAEKILKDGLKIHKKSNQLRVEMNYLKQMTTMKKKEERFEEQIFESDEEEDICKHSLFDSISERSSLQQKTKKHKLIRKTRTKKNEKVNNPEISKKLLNNTFSTLQSINSRFSEESSQSSEKKLEYFGREVKDSLQFLCQLDNDQYDRKGEDERERGILFSGQLRKRRSVTKRRFNFIYQNHQIIIKCIKFVMNFMKEVIRAKMFQEGLSLAQILSKANFFKCRNKIPEFQSLKAEIFEIGILCCLHLSNQNKAVFFLRFLLNRSPQHPFYLLLAHHLANSQKFSLTATIKKDFDSLIQVEEDYSKIFYLIALEYMDNCYFQQAITLFLKIIHAKSLSQQALKHIHLCLTTCFLQIGSSRTVFNKLDHVNRSAFCLKKYIEVKNELGEDNNHSSIEVLYNLGRWFSQVKMHEQAIKYLEQVLRYPQPHPLQKQAAYTLLIIQKQIQNFDEVKLLRQKYFSI